MAPATRALVSAFALAITLFPTPAGGNEEVVAEQLLDGGFHCVEP